MTLTLRWTEHAVEQLAEIAGHISLVSPIYAEQTVDRIVVRLRQAGISRVGPSPTGSAHDRCARARSDSLSSHLPGAGGDHRSSRGHSRPPGFRVAPVGLITRGGPITFAAADTDICVARFARHCASPLQPSCGDRRFPSVSVMPAVRSEVRHGILLWRACRRAYRY